MIDADVLHAELIERVCMVYAAGHTHTCAWDQSAADALADLLQDHQPDKFGDCSSCFDDRPYPCATIRRIACAFKIKIEDD